MTALILTVVCLTLLNVGWWCDRHEGVLWEHATITLLAAAAVAGVGAGISLAVLGAAA